MPARLTLHHDRLFPADPRTRAIARELYAGVRALPIVSPHGHVPAELVAADEPFTDPVSLLVSPDHYVTRLLHASGVDLDLLGVGRDLDEAGRRRAWRLLCENWVVLAGTPSRLWLEATLAELFGVTVVPSAETAEQIFDLIAETLATPGFRPQALLQRFGVEVLATTDDPCDDLAAHTQLAANRQFSTRVLPTFRPDRYLDPEREDWCDSLDRLARVSGIDTSTYAGFIAAIENRRQFFIERGAVSADHSHDDVLTFNLGAAKAAKLFAAARAGKATPADRLTLRRHLLMESARMSVEDGLVMTLHPGVYRNHSTYIWEKYGPDTGHDIPTQIEFTRALRPLLDRFGNAEGFHLVLFTLDETTYSREIAPLAGFYRSVYAGAPWWFLDAPEAIRRYRGAVTETAGFTRTSGFIDDTRALCSIPARHDMARRLDCSYLAELVAEHRLDVDEAAHIASRLVSEQPRKVFKL